MDWAVSESDGNLESVQSEIVGENIDQLTTVSGNQASGQHELGKIGSGEYNIQLTVTDTAGNTVSQTKTVVVG